MLKKNASAVVCVWAVIALGVLAWLYGYHNQKSNDNLPALSSIAEMEEADVNELLAGYHRTQLRTVWEEPAFTNTNSDVWEIDGKTTLEVSYNNREKAVVCRLTKGDRIPELQTVSVSVTEAEGGDTFDLAGEVAETISQILDAGSWVPDAANCANDYALTFDGRTIYYHSDCGTFNERLEQSNQSLRLSDADRETVNAIIQTVIPHDLSPVEILPFSYEEVLQMWGKSDPGVKTDGFQNTSEAVIATPQQVIERAQNECTIKYDTTALAYDNAADIWRVTFYTEGSVGNSQDVYLNGNGLTALIIYGE